MEACDTAIEVIIYVLTDWRYDPIFFRNRLASLFEHVF